ncbi:hypothetical protein PENTCL1PPCAC_30354 [Pristionchus entomophagus]|uniref:Uncharacterized protein n=1 Tax=Pristionchus entomophagus TaxID=358040 RepID=A0AAV5UM11_9BILA|nr:hypothetical protein PENTCL1PPCAC_30354 [Pristionchus entomophagus]
MNFWAAGFPNTIFGSCVQRLLASEFGVQGQWTNIDCTVKQPHIASEMEVSTDQLHLSTLQKPMLIARKISITRGAELLVSNSLSSTVNRDYSRILRWSEQ